MVNYSFLENFYFDAAASTGNGTPPAASGSGSGTPPASGSGTPPATSGSGSGTPPAAIIYISDTKESCNKDKDCNYINCGNAETNETSHCLDNHCVKRLLSGEILDCPKKPDNISNETTNETTNGIADKTLSVSAIIFISLFLIILILWIIAGLAAFIMSFICFGYNNEPGYVYLGILLAFFFGPLYWIYYIYILMLF